MKTSTIRYPQRLAAGALALLLAGCAATPPAREDMLPQPPTAFSRSGARELPPQWWLAFGDPALETLMRQALDGNFSLRSAWARLRQAQALARREGAALLPSVDANASAAAQRPPGGGWSDSNEAALSAGYEVDLWGRLGATAEAAQLDARASAADLQTAAVTLSANVATTWYQLVAQRAQVALLEHQAQTNRELLALVEARFRAGLAAASDVHRQRQLLEQTAGELAQAVTNRTVTTRQLAVLLGTTPERLRLPPDQALPALAPLPATGLPAALVQRRPDLRSALLRIAAADARTAAAVAAQYPQLNLSAALTTPGGTGSLFSDWLSNLGAQLAGPLFDGGRRRAEVARTDAVALERLNDYGQALLEAVAEVEDALAREAGQRAFLARLEAQLHEAEQVVERERLRYFQGDSDYLSVLDALRSRQQLQRQRVSARGDLVAQRVALVRALAGGWEMEHPATTPAAVAGTDPHRSGEGGANRD